MSTVVADSIAVARKSYGRCSLNRGFFDAFYRNFVGSSAAIGPHFANTDMEQQKALLRRGISSMISYALGKPTGKIEVDRLATLHDRGHLSIDPKLYKFWIDSLVTTMAKYDREWSADVERAVRETLSIGVTRMAEAY